MLNPDQQAVAMGAVRDQIIALMHEHERESHDGQPCAANRASAVAFIAHCLGVRGEVWDYARSLLAQYDARCDNLNCEHDATGEEGTPT